MALFNEKQIGYLRLTRPANVVTAVSDIVAGAAIVGFFSSSVSLLSLALLCVATMGLYGGGIVFNDVFDRELDSRERPERPLPSGLISVREASIWGGGLLLLGCALAFAVNATAGLLAIAVSVSALVYNRFGKHHTFLGPINMGLCRGFNLLLGMSILPAVMFELAWLAVIPVVYIAAVTTISRGEVNGSARAPLYISAFLYLLVVNAIAFFAAQTNQWLALFFLAPFAVAIFRPLVRAISLPQGPLIGKAVKAGVLSLILMNAAWVAAAGAWPVAIAVALLLPLSMWLARRFAVT